MKYWIIGCTLVALFFSSIQVAATSFISQERAATILANEGIIRQRETLKQYRVTDSIWRQEMIGIAMRLASLEVDDNTPCMWVYLDVTRSEPNSWICKASELAAENNIITRWRNYPEQRTRLKPERNVSRSEAYSMILSALNVPLLDIKDMNSYLFSEKDVLWQKRVIATSYELWMTESTYNFDSNKDATRWEIFTAIVHSMNLSENENVPSGIEDLLRIITNTLQ